MADIATLALIGCFLAGDSIARDLHDEALHSCGVNARKGIASGAIIARVPARRVATLILSAGSNDPDNPNLRAHLEAIRARAHADRIVWILPIAARPRAIVADVARQHGDFTVSFAPARDGMHPQNNHALARDIAAIAGRQDAPDATPTIGPVSRENT